MKKFTLIFMFVVVPFLFVKAQPSGYYNGTEGLTGEDLKAALHNIIDGNTFYNYAAAKFILKNSDEDPNNASNLIMVYSGESIDKANFASNNEPNFWTREHTWAKSHGDFGTVMGPGTDCHHLKPEKNSVNTLRSYKDFDEGGTLVAGTTGCYADDDSFEPRDESKGDVARMIFYMDVRYEGNGEIDLTVVDQVNTFPNPLHGKLSSLYEWNLSDSPDAFEIRRNNVVAGYQGNRNPFIDHPEFIEMIWGSLSASPILIGNVQQTPEVVHIADATTISATASTNSGSITEVKLYYGTDYNNLNSSVNMTLSGNTYSATIPAQAQAGKLYYKIEATNGTVTNTIRYDYYVYPTIANAITTIYQIQGQGAVSPYNNQVVTTSGVVTGNYGDFYFLQHGAGQWNGLYVYDGGRNPQVGDSIVLTGTITEYYELTELKSITAYTLVERNKTLPLPALVTTATIASGSATAEAYEGVLVTVQNATCTSESIGYGMWTVDDGSGECVVHNSFIYEYAPELNAMYNITGPLNYDFSEFKIEIRSSNDVSATLDILPPTITNIVVNNATTIDVFFNENVNMAVALLAGNYSINNGTTVTAVSQIGFDYNKVRLTVSGLAAGEHILTITNIEDLLGNAVTEASYNFTVTSIEDNIKVQNSLQLFPNPVSENATIQFVSPQNTKVNIQILNQLGDVVFNQNKNVEVGQNNFVLPLSNLSAGSYILYIASEEFVVRKIFVVQ